MNGDSKIQLNSERRVKMDIPAMISAENECPIDDEARQVELAKRDPRAFAGLYRKHCGAISRYLYRRTGDVHTTEDLVSEVFLSALRFLPRYRHRGLSIRFWLYRIATNSANRWSRRNRLRFQSLPEEPLAPRTGNPEHGTELAQWVLLQLPPKHQAVLALHYFEGMTIDQVAVVVGCRAGTVKSRLSRARETLKQRLESRR